jgi:hypothetical protein
MCFTPLGRIQTRLLSLVWPLGVTSVYATWQGASDYWTLFALMFIVALSLDFSVYRWVIRYQPRWLTIALGVFEFFVIANLLAALPIVLIRLTMREMAEFYGVAWFGSWVTTQAVLPLLYPRWAEDGGELRRVVAPQPARALATGNRALVTFAFGVLMLLIGVGIGYYGRAFVATPATTQSPLMEAAIAHTRHFKGEVNAPVTIIEFGEMPCEACAKFMLGIGRQVDEQYVKTGVVRYGYQHRTLTPLAEASECAAEQGVFWAYRYDALDRPLSFPNVTLNTDALRRIASERWLDMAAFDTCLVTNRYREQVLADVMAANSLNVTTAPTFLINGQLVSGVTSFEALQVVIEVARVRR